MNINANRRMKEWRVFATIVETQSITLAAEAMYIEPCTVSKSLALLESEIGMTLIERTTRHLKVTQSGMELYDRVKVIINAMDSFVEDVLENKNNIEGVLRIAAPTIFCEFLLCEWILDFQKTHKNAHFNIRAFDKYTEISPGNYDIIIHTGSLSSDLMVCKEMDSINLIVCASEQYIKNNPKINHPKDLLDAFILSPHHSKLSSPVVFKKNDDDYKLHIKTNKIKTDNVLLKFNLMLKGDFITISTPSWLAYDYLKSGQVIRLLPDWKLPKIPVFMLWKQNKFRSNFFLEFVDFLDDAWEKRNKLKD
ncbi:LysR family transcriptional regulator [Yersinia wautersii]|uniref:Lys family transcriptional regulatory protein n=3 Tax=Yersinia pseudotuberculosis TaxID=633 RepID=A0A380Q8P1_YERPU|nr:LysR family transcriptional regulator [Yersinia pseudotuberculosis]SUP82961.1 Lys family transcriptional regulatory protein [Yersinia pseudotuberculosis]